MAFQSNQARAAQSLASRSASADAYDAERPYYAHVMVSAIRPEAPRIKYPNRSGLGTRGNKQRLTKDVTPLPRLEDLRQGLRMPGHAS